MPPQPLETVPQFLPVHAVAICVGVQPQTPVAPQIWGAVQVPQVYVPPQPFGAVPQFLPEHAVAMGVGTQAQAPAELHVLGAVQVPHE